MKNKIKIIIVFLSLLLFIYFAGLTDDTGDIIRYVGMFGILALVLWFSRTEIIKPWCVFSLVYWVLSIIMIFSSAGGSFGVSGGRIMAMYILSGAYFLISLILIIYKSIKLRGK
jgi:hypothetical protein